MTPIERMIEGMRNDICEQNVANGEEAMVLIREYEKLRATVQNFVDKNFHGGSKADREDYSTRVSCKDIWDLREAINLNSSKELRIRDK
ncbi:hypothetical protein ACFYKX_11730 [Cytobacillus sp. FJAT-54145]|uniref:Uncharacterized protein n=1 Tax=Cytobacillus spartinae TaxID=3299023 RepID=A0ABW6KAN4_9BACI